MPHRNAAQKSKRPFAQIFESTQFAPKKFHGPPEKGNFIHKLLGKGRPRQERIALINSLADIQKKTRLIVGDALLGIYEKGPTGSPQRFISQIVSEIKSRKETFPGLSP